jgi:hypothetical protein
MLTRTNRRNDMTKKELVALVTKFGGWMEGDVARFPSVYQKEQFEKALAASKAKSI